MINMEALVIVILVAYVSLLTLATGNGHLPLHRFFHGLISAGLKEIDGDIYLTIASSYY